MKSANPTQTDLFTAEEAKRAGIAEVLGHTKMSWQFAMLHAATQLVKEGKTFTSEDLTDLVGMPPNHPSAVGAVIGGIVRQLGLKSCGRVNGKHPKSHAAKLEVWGKK